MDSNIVTVRRLQRFWNGCKTWVENHFTQQAYHAVALNADGTVNTYANTLDYATVLANLANPLKRDVLSVTWGNTNFLCPASETVDAQNNGDIKFITEVEYSGIQRYIVFTLTPQSVLTTTMIRTFQIVPAVVYSDATGLAALETNMSATPSWQLTGLNLAPFRRIKVYTKAAQKSGATASASTTPSTCLEMVLDPALAISAYDGHYLASIVIQKSNDRNRLATLTCAVSADKTSFAVMRQTNLYGTGATDNNDVGSNVVLIEGYYD